MSYSTIEPMLAESRVCGRVLECTFRCPRTGRRVESRGLLQSDTRVTRAQVESQGLLVTVRDYVDRTLSQQLEGGEGSSVSSESMRRRAVEEAFARVRDLFVWDAGRWVLAEAIDGEAHGFTLQLSRYPIRERFDRFVMTRLLSEVVRADGRVDECELNFFTENQGIARSFEEIAAQPPLGQNELERVTSRGVGETIIMLAWTVSLVDRNLARQEVECIAQAGRLLGIDQARSRQLYRYAQLHLLRLATDGDVIFSQPQLDKLCHDLGLSVEDLKLVRPQRESATDAG